MAFNPQLELKTPFFHTCSSCGRQWAFQDCRHPTKEDALRWSRAVETCPRCAGTSDTGWNYADSAPTSTSTYALIDGDW